MIVSFAMTKPLITYDPSQAWQEHLCTSPTFGYSQVESYSCSCCRLDTQKEKKPCPNCLCICTALWPKMTLKQWLVSFVTSRFSHCQWAALSLSDFPASQRGYKSIPTQFKRLADIELKSRGDFPVFAFFLLTFQSTPFLWEKKKVVLFSLSLLQLPHWQRHSSEMLPVLLTSLCLRYLHCTTEL